VVEIWESKGAGVLISQPSIKFTKSVECQAHGCTRLKIKRGGSNFWQNPGGGARLLGQNCHGGPLFWVLFHFYKQVFISSSLRPPPPLCASMARLLLQVDFLIRLNRAWEKWSLQWRGFNFWLKVSCSSPKSHQIVLKIKILNFKSKDYHSFTIFL
jgi:hypothetical protein